MESSGKKKEIVKKKREVIKQAAALKYSPDSDIAPRVIAAGKGQIAENIIEAAKKNKIPIYRDEKLVRALGSLPLGQAIPPELYEIVAEILVFIHDVDRKYGELVNGR